MFKIVIWLTMSFMCVEEHSSVVESGWGEQRSLERSWVLTLSSGSGCDEASPKSIATTSPEPLRTIKLDVVRSPCTTWGGTQNQPKIISTPTEE